MVNLVLVEIGVNIREGENSFTGNGGYRKYASHFYINYFNSRFGGSDYGKEEELVFMVIVVEFNQGLERFILQVIQLFKNKHLVGIGYDIRGVGNLGWDLSTCRIIYTHGTIKVVVNSVFWIGEGRIFEKK